MSTVDYFDGPRGRYPLHPASLVEKAIKTANWQDEVAHTVFLSPLPRLEDAPGAFPNQRLWLCRALTALTRDEMIKLYDSLIASHDHCLANGDDHTPQIVRDQLPHLYKDKVV